MGLSAGPLSLSKNFLAVSMKLSLKRTLTPKWFLSIALRAPVNSFVVDHRGALVKEVVRTH